MTLDASATLNGAATKWGGDWGLQPLAMFLAQTPRLEEEPTLSWPSGIIR